MNCVSLWCKDRALNCQAEGMNCVSLWCEDRALNCQAEGMNCVSLWCMDGALVLLSVLLGTFLRTECECIDSLLMRLVELSWLRMGGIMSLGWVVPSLGG